MRLESISIGRRTVMILLGAVSLLSLLYQPKVIAQAQQWWNSNGSDIYNTNTGNVGIGTTTPTALLHVVASGSDLLQAGNFTISNLGNPSNVVRYSSRVYPQPLGGAAESAGLYMRVDPGSSQLFGIYGEITSSQQDGVGALMRVLHQGHGDAIYVGVLGAGGSSIESASFVDSTATFGSKGIISTIQAANPNAANTLFNALWANSTLPLYGMYYADQAPANALTIRKFTSAPDNQTQIRIWENDLSRERFSVFNDGTLRIAGLAASASATVRSSPPLVLRGAYWNGTGSIDRDWKVQGVVSGTPASRLSFQDPSGTERMFVQDNGNVGITGDITVTGNIAARYQDLAEWVPSIESLPPGTVVTVDPKRSNFVKPSSEAYDTRVAGVVSSSPGILLGDSDQGKVKVATTGRVRVRVDAIHSPIQAGDLLVTSDKAGMAMRSEPLNVAGVSMHRPGTLIGKALESLEHGEGEILVLLSLQ